MKRLYVILLVMVIVISAVTATQVRAEDEPLTNEQLQAITQGCPLAKVALQRIQRDDLATRLIRGRSYNASLMLMRTLNVRLSNNDIDASALSPIPSQLNAAYQRFYNDYKNYDNSIERTIQATCDNPANFYNLLQTTRAYRETLQNDSNNLAELITLYENQVITLQKQYLPPEPEQPETEEAL